MRAPRGGIYFASLPIAALLRSGRDPSLETNRRSGMKISNLEELMVNEMRDFFHAEKQLVRPLPQMAKAATSDELRTAFTEHLEETRHQMERLEEGFKLLGQKAKARTCEGMRGLVTEGSELIEDTEESQVRDAGLIAAAQRVEHYEIS